MFLDHFGIVYLELRDKWDLPKKSLVGWLWHSVCW